VTGGNPARSSTGRKAGRVRIPGRDDRGEWYFRKETSGPADGPGQRFDPTEKDRP
jgi:hypothetical protein